MVSITGLDTRVAGMVGAVDIFGGPVTGPRNGVWKTKTRTAITNKDKDSHNYHAT